MTRPGLMTLSPLMLFCGLCLIRAVASDEPGTAEAAAGAADHWSFRPVRRPPVPVVEDQRWARNAIDRFVLAKLEGLGISPSPEADRVTLIRRLTLDLLGLPPTPAEVQEFANDPRPDAYEQLVERLLTSPHFGERWGRHWLDLARYADSDGYEKDSPRLYAYLYRNWVIDAINRDLPFDQFTIEQLAGDLLPNATLQQKTATGFHRNTLTNKEGGVDPEEFRNKANVDRVSTTATAWLGLTLACAECHNHKYDPFTQREFYSLFSFFNTSREVDLPAPQPAELAAYESAKRTYDETHAKLQAALDRFDREQLPGRLAEWERSLAGMLPTPRWVPLDATSAISAGGATLLQQPDGSIQVAGKSPPSDTYTIGVQTDVTGITAFRLEVLPDERHPAKGPGRVKHGNFVLNEFRVEVIEGANPSVARAEESERTGQVGTSKSVAIPAVSSLSPAPQVPPGEAGKHTRVALQNATADFSQDRYAVAGAIDGNPGTGWAIAPRFGERHVAVFETKDSVASYRGTTLVFTLDQQYGTEHTIGRLRLSASSESRPVPADDMPDEAIAALRIPADQRNEEQASDVINYYRSVDSERKKLRAAIIEHAKKIPPPPATQAMAIAENLNPPATHIHIRGDFLRKGDPVEPGPPALLAAAAPFPAEAGHPSRLDLARWLVDPANPLTARVTVNRIWQLLFGRGVVATPNDFGTRGEPPSHPELLDWLACELTASSRGAGAGRSEVLPQAWSLKAMIKLIATSATYRQSSTMRPDLADRDPSNTLLARQNRFRLESEIIRDACLAASGLLTRAIGGPSVRPPQPAGVSDLTYAGSAKWLESQGADRYRRGMYTWLQRTSPYPMLMTFDSPDGVNCTVRRERSNTPLQSLTLLNDTVFVECAQGLARRVFQELPSADRSAWIRHAFRLCMSREPRDVELARLAALHAELVADCRQNADATSKLAGALTAPGVDAAEAAAWVALARTIMNLDEFITRE